MGDHPGDAARIRGLLELAGQGVGFLEEERDRLRNENARLWNLLAALEGGVDLVPGEGGRWTAVVDGEPVWTEPRPEPLGCPDCGAPVRHGPFEECDGTVAMDFCDACGDYVIGRA